MNQDYIEKLIQEELEAYLEESHYYGFMKKKN